MGNLRCPYLVGIAWADAVRQAGECSKPKIEIRKVEVEKLIILSSYLQFADNEIAGTILLDIGLDDLDYMGIKVLAHRKKLLKGIEELKRNGKVGNNPPPPPGDSSSSSSSNNNVGAEAKAESQPQHWSNVKPMSENKVENNDVYDEQAEAAGERYHTTPHHTTPQQLTNFLPAFKNAVMEWRSGTTNGQTANTIEPKEGEWTIGVSKGVMEQQQQVISDGGVFSFGGGRGSDYTDLLGGDHDLLNGGGGDGSAPNELTEAEDAAAFKAAVMDWRSGGTKTHENDAKDAGGGGGALLQGSYDEAAEGEAFKKAVADFRNPNPSSNSTSNSTSGGAGADTAPADSQTVAANLAKRMELEFEEKKEAMKTKRREAEEALKERLRNKEQELTEMYANKENIGEFDFDEEEYRRAESKNDDDHDEEEEEEEKEERNTISFQSPSKTIGVQLLGTEMWSPEAKDAENTGCVIEEESSDEE